MEARRAVHDQSEQRLILGVGFKGKISKGFADSSIAMRAGFVGHDQPSLYYLYCFKSRLDRLVGSFLCLKKRLGGAREEVGGNEGRSSERLGATAPETCD